MSEENYSEKYWLRRYKSGGSAGLGSQGILAKYKAQLINAFVRGNEINTVIDFGCGDGSQSSLFDFTQYLGFEISEEALNHCRQVFTTVTNWKFKLMRDYDNEQAELTISLDVIYHLVENPVFNNYMERLFGASQKFVLIYSTNFDKEYAQDNLHIRHRQFTTWIEHEKPGWKLYRHIPNKYRHNKEPHLRSSADFYIFKKHYPAIM